MCNMPLKGDLWSLNTLKAKILQRGLTQKEQLIYITLVTSISILLISQSATNLLNPFYYVFLQKYIKLPIFIGAIILAYKYNGGNQGKDFISRYIAFNCIIFFRISVMLVLPLSIIYYELYKNLNLSDITYMKIKTVMSLLVITVSYWRICYNIRDLRRKEIYNNMNLNNEHKNSYNVSA